MISMYQLLMDLPIFKGSSSEQISYFLEKTPIEFKNIEVGETFAKLGDKVEKVICVLNGKYSITKKFTNSIFDRISIDFNGGSVVGIERLFGMDHHFNFNAVAKSRLCMLEFCKADYLDTIEKERLFQINLLNYLSYRAQKPNSIIEEFAKLSSEAPIRAILNMFTDSNVEQIEIYLNLEMGTNRIEDWSEIVKDLQLKGERYLNFSVKQNGNLLVFKRTV